MNTDNVQTVEKILSKTTFLDQAFKMLVSSGNDAHVHLHRFMSANPVEFTISQHPQQAGLKLCRHVADLVQKKGAAIGLLKAAQASGLRTCEGPALMAEEF